MDHILYYLELSSNPIRFDSVSQLTNVFFDDSNKQVFAVRSGGATGVVVKGPTEAYNFSFCMEDHGPIRSVKFSPDNKILAVQRTENSVEFITFNSSNQPNINEILTFKGKNTEIFGFVWVAAKEVALISNAGIEIFLVIPEKRQLKSIKSVSLTLNWFSWCPTGNFALVSSMNGTILTPILLKQNTITKLPKVELEPGKNVQERDVTLAYLYNTACIFILRQTPSRLIEVVIYMLNGPGLAPKKSHILRLGLSGRFAMSVIDDLIIVHHQASACSLLFDIGLTGEEDPISKVICHGPITPGRSLKPFSLKLPSISLDGQSMKCELYSRNWVLFQPDIVIDAKLGCLWYVILQLEPICSIITDKVRLVEFLLQRTEGKPVLLSVLKEMMSTQYNGILLPMLENIFNRLNIVYKSSIEADIQNQMAQPSSVKQGGQTKQPKVTPRILINQSDMFKHVFTPIVDSEHIGNILILYLHSLAKFKIAAQDELSRMIINDLVKRKKLNILQQLLNYSLITESKPLACFLLSLSNVHQSIEQMALDMLGRLNANDIIIEVLLGQGKIIDALNLARQFPKVDLIPARKYLEAAQKSNDSIIFYSVFNFFEQRNFRLRNSPEFLKSEQCGEYVQYYRTHFKHL